MSEPRRLTNQKKYRTIFLSDIHLGFKGCQAEFLLDFLGKTESEFLYLVGDIFDGWEMQKKSYWSLAAHLKHKVKNVVSYIGRFEEAVVSSARTQGVLGVQGVVCGHIHHAEMMMIGETLYCNTGDWVESCTAMVENRNGTLEILKWTEQAELIKSDRRPKRAPLLNAA